MTPWKRLLGGCRARSPWLFHLNAGSCNGCDIELVTCLSPRYDAEQLGVKLEGSPRHADILCVSGPVTRNTVQAVRMVHGQVCDPKVVVAIGSWDPPNSQLHDTLDNVVRDALRRKRIRAEVCSTMIDEDGKQILGGLLDRSISITAEQLRRIPEVVAVAGGRSKIAAIRAVLRAGFVTSLVTDTGAGEALIEMASKAPPAPARSRRR